MILGERDETKRNWVLCSHLYYKKKVLPRQILLRNTFRES